MSGLVVRLSWHKSVRLSKDFKAQETILVTKMQCWSNYEIGKACQAIKLVNNNLGRIDSLTATAWKHWANTECSGNRTRYVWNWACAHGIIKISLEMPSESGYIRRAFGTVQ